MQVPRPTEADKEFLRSIVPDDPRVEVKPMFGNLGVFVEGTMFAGLLGSAVGVRLGDEDRAELATVPGSGPFGPDGRPMGGYLRLPAEWRDQPEVAAGWLERAMTYVATLPPKAPRSRKAAGGRE